MRRLTEWTGWASTPRPPGSRRDPGQARSVELRFFGGPSVEETAQTLEICKATVTRDRVMAKAYLARELATP